ncbi:helix-turn-helix transcriptional regulator [Erwinia sp. DT-104]|uniref:helix-turn-helix transcriptional regulator n=1 Tax=Erwinia sp. DT-104 TaxID=3396161 RepID=UPI003F1A8CE8
MKIQSLPKNLINMFENDPITGWAVKDINSNFVYVNNAFKIWQTISTRFDYEGLNIRDVPVPVAEFADIFAQQEREIEQTGKAVRAITTHIQGKEKILQPAYNIQEPLFNEQRQCVGTVISVRHVNIITPGALLNGKLCQHVTLQPPSTLFTEKEWEVVYLLQCNLSLKEVAHVLGISIHAVSGRLRSCYRKAEVSSSSMLIEFCREKNIDNYVPAFFLKKGHIIISG